MPKTEGNSAPFSYDGLDRVIHEKARLGLMTSLMAHPKGLAFADLKNPNAVVRTFTGNFADALLGMVDLPPFEPDIAAQKITWDARRTRVRLGAEQVPVYRLEAGALGYSVRIDVSTLGEVLCVDLPGNVTARIDEWSKP